jgi:hypothetical protein
MLVGRNIQVVYETLAHDSTTRRDDAINAIKMRRRRLRLGR